MNSPKGAHDASNVVVSAALYDSLDRLSEAQDRLTTISAALETAREVIAFTVGMVDIGEVFADWDYLRKALADLDASTKPVTTESATRNSQALQSFVEYCIAHPGERFWQALRNWSKWGFILGANERNGPTLDTFHIEGLDGNE